MRYLLLGLMFAAGANAAQTCEALAKASLPDTTITTAQAIAAGAFQPVRDLPAFCRVTGIIKPSSDSAIQFEVWMPAAGWNGRLQGLGNGGYAGSFSYEPMGSAVAHGYAVAATDTGHTGGGTSAGWALGHPQKVIDFGHRAIHETAVKAKALIAAFYGEGPKHSYFNSCSNGGRQALMEAQRYPADYDGIIAGAPANYWTHLLTEAVWTVQAMMKDDAHYIPAAKLPAIEGAALAACDAGDGVKDGVIDEPGKCKFDPSKLLCGGPETDACLTAPQLEALKMIYSGPRNAKSQSVFPGFPVGGETGAGGWGAWITGMGQGKSLGYAFGTQFFTNMVYENASWDYKTFQVDRDMQAADEKLAKVLNATDPDLKSFQSRGGKLIMYHGWSDAAIPATSTIDYYNSVVAKMGSRDSDAFVRLYMAPGMQHCGGGPGPNVFGTGGAPLGDAQHDAGRALERWVEEGVAPKEIIASRFNTGNNPASGVSRTRPLCPYPQVAKWKGSGSTDDAANFTCAVSK